MKMFIVCACLFLSACTPRAYRQTNKAYRQQVRQFAKLLREYPVTDSGGLSYAAAWVGTTNFGMRRPDLVVIHHTAQNSCAQTLKTFTQPRTQVSAHYVICKDGTVHHMLNDLLRAHHAGVGKWGNTTDVNSSSIGIEIDNNGEEPFTQAQMESLVTLLGRLKRAYNISPANFIGHADLAPGRKVDPGNFFPWADLAAKGFGRWYDTTGVKVPVEFNPLLALRVIGYSVKQPEAAVSSFKLHYVPADTSRVLSEADLKILFSLEEQSQ